MGKSLRRHSEDSVVVSIGEVRDMLQDEVRPVVPRDKTLQRPVPMAVPVAPKGQAIKNVPSMAEVRAEREARWREEPVPMAQAARVTGFVWRRRAKAAALVLLGLLAGVSLMWANRGPEIPPEVQSKLDAQAAEVTRLGGVVAGLEAEKAALTEQARALAGEIAAAKAAIEELRASPAGPAAAKEERQKARAPKKRRASPPKRRVRSRRMTRADKKFDSLLDSL